MVASKLKPAPAGHPQIAGRESAPLVVTEPVALRTQTRSNTNLSLPELHAKVERYPESVREDTRFVQGYFIQHCRGDIDRMIALADKKLGLKLGTAYLHNWLKGYYFRGGSSDVGEQGQATWLAFCRALRDLNRTEHGAPWLIKTPTFHGIRGFVLERMGASFGGKMGGIAGMTGMQKGASLRGICEQVGYPRAVRMECPSRDAIVGFQRKLAALKNCRVLRRAEAREQAIADAFGSDDLLIVHNVQRAFQAKRMMQPIFEYMMELQEDRNFALVMEFKRDFYHSRLQNDEAAGYFAQLIGRFGGAGEIFQLPDYPTKGDLRAISRHFKLPGNDGCLDYLERWSQQPGRIRIVFRKLERALMIAQLDQRENILVRDIEAADRFVPEINESAGDGEEREG